MHPCMMYSSLNGDMSFALPWVITTSEQNPEINVVTYFFFPAVSLSAFNVIGINIDFATCFMCLALM